LITMEDAKALTDVSLFIQVIFLKEDQELKEGPVEIEGVRLGKKNLMMNGGDDSKSIISEIYSKVQKILFPQSTIISFSN
jgi:hypothetical protein